MLRKVCTLMNSFSRRIAVALLLAVCLVCFIAMPSALAYVVRSGGPVKNSFYPSYDPETDTVFVNITVRKTVDCVGKKSIGPEDFAFRLEDENGLAYNAVSNEKGLAVFALSFTSDQIGKHSFSLYEVADKRPGVTYSELKYDVVIDVERAQNALTARVTMNGVETAVAAFRNVYNSKNDPTTPETGVRAPAIYGAMLAAGVIGMIALVIWRKKKV